KVLLEELSVFRDNCFGDGSTFPPAQTPWDFVVRWAEENASLETAELLNSLLLELYPELVDELENETGSDEQADTIPYMSVRELKTIVEREYDWALNIDFGKSEAQHFFWYWSAEKLEPRLGERQYEPGADREMRIDVAREVFHLHQDLSRLDDDDLDKTVAEFLIARPHWRHITRRVQSLATYPYAEIRDNLLDRECLAINLLRCKLSIFGAGKFDPKSDHWTRIALFQGAPLADELVSDDVDDWSFPVVPEVIGPALA
ncbi:MAG: hypothetical protein ACE5KS_09205, partial [Woeseiaceae bacterium]